MQQVDARYQFILFRYFSDAKLQCIVTNYDSENDDSSYVSGLIKNIEIKYD